MSYVQKQPMGAKRHIPVIRVSFHTETACYQTKGEVLDKTYVLDPTNQVLSVSTQKTMDSPAGAFTVQLVGDSWATKLKPNDLVVITAGYKTTASSGFEVDTVMVGLVDTIRTQRSAGDGTPEVSTAITGRDFGKVLIKSMLRFYPEVGFADKSKDQKFFLTDEGWLTLMSFFTNENITEGTPAVILDNIMREILQKLNDVSWTVWDESKKTPVPKRAKIGNVLRYAFERVNMFMPMILTADQFEGAIWNLMERASIKPFTELFVDVREGSEAWNNAGRPMVTPDIIEESSSPAKAAISGGNTQKGAYPSPRINFGTDQSAVMVVLRNTPFDKPTWEKLYTHDLPAVDVLEEELSLSDNEHYNLFWAGTTINPLGFDLKREAPPLFNESDAKRYGISPLEVQVEGLAISVDPTTGHNSLVSMSQAFSAKLKAWFEKNHEYLSGTITVRGKGSYRIGQRLLRKGIKREFYIEGVTQSFNVFSGWTTTLQVTRGMSTGTAPDHDNYLPKSVEVPPKKPTSAKTDAEIKADNYTVKLGDSLWNIAGQKKIYNDTSQWTKIWSANKDMLIKRDSRNAANHGQYIYVGQILRIPR